MALRMAAQKTLYHQHYRKHCAINCAETHCYQHYLKIVPYQHYTKTLCYQNCTGNTALWTLHKTLCYQHCTGHAVLRIKATVNLTDIGSLCGLVRNYCALGSVLCPLPCHGCSWLCVRFFAERLGFLANKTWLPFDPSLPRVENTRKKNKKTSDLCPVSLNQIPLDGVWH